MPPWVVVLGIVVTIAGLWWAPHRRARQKFAGLMLFQWSAYFLRAHLGPLGFDTVVVILFLTASLGGLLYGDA